MQKTLVNVSNATVQLQLFASLNGERSLEMLAFDTPRWRATAQLRYGWLHT